MLHPGTCPLFSFLEPTPLFLLPLAVTRVESGGHVNVQLNILTKVRHSHKCGRVQQWWTGS